jgi:hypothetical protein
VHKHLEHLYRKLGVRDRLMAVQRARDAGLLATPPHPGRDRGHGPARRGPERSCPSPAASRAPPLAGARGRACPRARGGHAR